MKTLKALLLLLACGFLSSQVLAEDGMSLIDNDNSVERSCNYYYSPYECNRAYGCSWDYYRDYCQDDRGDDDYYRSCYEIRSSYSCSLRDDCYWSTSRNRCVSTGGGGGGGGSPYPGLCYRIGSPYECSRHYECHWSRAFDRCVGRNDI